MPWSSLLPPPPDADPRETFQWLRRFELAGGIGCIALGLALWNAGWAHWLLLGVGLVSLSPWGPGARSLLRKADEDPDRFVVTDPERRRHRARRTAQILVPVYFVAAGIAGYIIDGWAAAIFMAVIIGSSAAVGAWLFLRRAH